MEWNSMSKFINSLRAGLQQPQTEATMMKDTGEIVHNCAKHVEHAEWGQGATLAEEHAAPDANGNIAWYDIMFEHGLERQVPTETLNILVSETHMHASKKKIKENVNAGGETAIIDLGSNTQSVKAAANLTKANVATPGQVAGAKEGGEKEIIKQGVKEETEALDEASIKLFMGMYQVWHKGKKIASYNSRTDAQDHANSLREEVEELDELTKQTLSSYVKKASGDREAWNDQRRGASAAGDQETAAQSRDMAKKRDRGVNLARAKMGLKNDGYYAAKPLPPNKARVKANESVEELDELSDDLLQRYGSRANMSAWDAQKRARAYATLGDTEARAKERATSDKRRHGVGAADSRINARRGINHVTTYGKANPNSTAYQRKYLAKIAPTPYMKKEDLDLTAEVDETIEYKTMTIEVNEADKNYDGYFKAAMKAHGVKHPGELKTAEDKKKFFNKVDAGFKAKNEDVFVEAYMRSDVEERIAAHTKAGNKISDRQHTTKNGQGFHSYVVTEPSGKRTRHIFHGNSRKLETMSAAPKSKLAHEAGEDEDDK